MKPWPKYVTHSLVVLGIAVTAVWVVWLQEQGWLMIAGLVVTFTGVIMSGPEDKETE